MTNAERIAEAFSRSPYEIAGAVARGLLDQIAAHPLLYLSFLAAALLPCAGVFEVMERRGWRGAFFCAGGAASFGLFLAIAPIAQSESLSPAGADRFGSGSVQIPNEAPTASAPIGKNLRVERPPGN